MCGWPVCLFSCGWIFGSVLLPEILSLCLLSDLPLSFQIHRRRGDRDLLGTLKNTSGMLGPQASQRE